MPSDQAAVVVDETPISPVREGTQRRNSLEKHLQHRPDPQDLKNRHILLDTNAAPSLQSKQVELERQRASDSLKKGLASRPEKEDLINRNILPSTTAAPALQAHQKELERQMRADNLEKALGRRPTADELVKEGILTADEVPAAGAAKE